MTQNDGHLEGLVGQRLDRIKHLESEVARLRWRNRDLNKKLELASAKQAHYSLQLANLRASRLGRLQVWYWRARQG